MTNLKTTIRTYRFDTRRKDECEAWDDLRTRLESTHPHCMESHGGAMHFQHWMTDREVELETAHLFSNQWNTAPIPGVSDLGYRVFDWALDYMPSRNPNLKQGHYLEQTDAMREIRRNTDGCGYCGKQEPAAKGYVFCPHCLGSQYLKASELHLTRMQPVNTPFAAKRAELTDAERAHLLPLYREAQLHGRTEADRKRIAKARADITHARISTIANANVEADGLLWLMDRGIRTDNVIYYNHTRRFCFGWRAPVDAEFLSAVLDVASEFPYPYDIKTADGRTLSGG